MHSPLLLLPLLACVGGARNVTRSPEYQPEGCLQCGEGCLAAAQGTLIPCITAAVGEATACRSLIQMAWLVRRGSVEGV